MKYISKKLLALCLVASMLLTGIPFAGALAPEEPPVSPQSSAVDWDTLFDLSPQDPVLPAEGTYAPNRLLVTRVDTGARSMPLAHSSIKSTSTLFSQPLPQGEQEEAAPMNLAPAPTVTCSIVSLEEGSDMLAVMEELSAQEGVLAVEVDRWYTAAGTPTFAPAEDPFVAQQTWLDFIDAPKAWETLAAQNTVPGENVTVAVLDSGIDSAHPDLKDQIAPGGRQFMTDAPDGAVIASDNYEDGSGHGTHVSAIIAGAKNGVGITGVAYGAKILPIKVLDDASRGSASGIIAGMMYAAGKMDADARPSNDPARCQIANMSLGWIATEPDKSMELAIGIMRNAGIFLVLAAGNESLAASFETASNHYSSYNVPNYIPGGFSVMAMQETPREKGQYLASFSNWDPTPYEGTEYHIMAPGAQILSAINQRYGHYQRRSGTSMASPTVAGAAALILSAHPRYQTEDLWAVLATSGQKRLGKVDDYGKEYYYHTLDVAAALQADPTAVKSVVKGQAEGYWTEVPALGTGEYALVLPMNGSYPKVKLTLRGFDNTASHISATSEDLTGPSGILSLAPGGTAEMIFSLKEWPDEDMTEFQSEITVTWKNSDGTTGREIVPVDLVVVRALPGDAMATTPSSEHTLWIFEQETEITLPFTPNGTPPESQVMYNYGMYYFGKEGKLVLKDTTEEAGGTTEMFLNGANMVDPQLSGNIALMLANIQSKGVKRDSRSTIDIKVGMLGCRVDGYNNLNLRTDGNIKGSTFAYCGWDSTIAAANMCNNTFLNNFQTQAPYECIDLAVTESLPLVPSEDSIPHGGFCHNAVIGPAEVYHTTTATMATATDCYYLPTASQGDSPFAFLAIPDEKNKLVCAEDSTVYVEGSTATRPDMLEDCPPFLISTTMAPGFTVDMNTGKDFMAYRLKSVFSTHMPSYARYFTYLGNLPYFMPMPGEDVVWAEDSQSCEYTVYTLWAAANYDDFFTLDFLSLPKQEDRRNPIHQYSTLKATLNEVSVTKEEGSLTLTWTKAAPTTKEGTLEWDTWDGETQTHKLTQEELTAHEVVLPISELQEGISELQEGDVYRFSLKLSTPVSDAEPGRLLTGTAWYREPYEYPDFDAFSLGDHAGNPLPRLDLSGTNSVALTLRTDRSFSMKNGLKATVTLNGQALTLTGVSPSVENLHVTGVAQDGNTAVAELSPLAKDLYFAEGILVAALIFQGKNVTSDGELTIELTDFFGNELITATDAPVSFTIPVKTTAVSSGGDDDYTPPKKDSTTQTLPDGTRVTTTTNPDGSTQIVYLTPDGVRSTVKTPAKGDVSSASISLPSSLENKSVRVSLPMPEGSATTVAVLVGADGKEQVLPGSYWKDGVLSVPLTGSANLIIRDNAKPFADLKAEDWFAKDVAFVTSRELFQGVGENRFAPQQTTSRAMLFVVLQRLAGEASAPKAGETWYDGAMAWAKERGISDGTLPMENITRQQLAVMLYRYAGSPAATKGTATFPDSATIADWAQSAMAWAVENGILQGGANGELNPLGEASRAEVAAMLTRFVPLT